MLNAHSWISQILKDHKGRSEERGAVSTLGILFAILVIGLSLGIGVQAMSYQTHMTMEGSNHMQSANTIQMLETRMTRDAASAASVYFPTGCTSNCDDVRFAKRNTDGSWAFWGYAAVPSQQGVAYCTYSLANSARCSSPLIAPNLLGFRVDQVSPTSVASSDGIAVVPETYTKQVYFNSADANASLVTTGNNIFVARFATARDIGEAHLMPGVISNSVSEVANINAAAARGLAGGTYGFNFVEGDTVGPPYYTYPSQTTTFDVDRYNGGMTINGQNWPDNASAQSNNCYSSVAPVGHETGVLSGNVQNNGSYNPATGTTAQLTLTATQYYPGLCYFNVAMTSPNANDTPTTAGMYIDVYGPLTSSPSSLSFQNPLETSANTPGTQEAVSFYEQNLVEGSQGGTIEPASQNCTNIVSYTTSASGGYIANGTDGGTLYVTAIAPGSCTITVQGAWGTTKGGVIPITVGYYSPLTPNSGNSITIPNASSVSATYTATEANDPNGFTFVRQSDNATWTSGEACLYNSSNQCFAGVFVTSNAAGQAQYYVTGNGGSGEWGSASFSINDGHGQNYVIGVTVSQNPIVGGESYTLTSAGAAGPSLSVTENGYSGSFAVVRLAPAAYGISTGSFALQNSSSVYIVDMFAPVKNGDNIYQFSFEGYCLAAPSCVAATDSGGTTQYYLQDTNYQVSPTYTITVNGSGGLVSPGNISFVHGTGYTGVYSFTESNDWQTITFSCSPSLTTLNTTNSVGNYGFEVSKANTTGARTCTADDQHGHTATITITVS